MKRALWIIALMLITGSWLTWKVAAFIDDHINVYEGKNIVRIGDTVYVDGKLVSGDDVDGDIEYVSEPVKIDEYFDEISVYNNIKLIYTVGSKTSMTIKYPKGKRDKIKIEVTDDCLSIKTKDLRGKVVVTLTSPDVDTFSAYNNGAIKVKSELRCKDITAHGYNNGSITFEENIRGTETTLSASNNSSVIVLKSLSTHELDADASNNASVKVKTLTATVVEADASNNASIKLSGEADRVKFDASNMAGISASDLKAETGTAHASNMASIKCSVEKLTQKTSNMANISNR